MSKSVLGGGAFEETKTTDDGAVDAGTIDDLELSGTLLIDTPGDGGKAGLTLRTFTTTGRNALPSTGRPPGSVILNSDAGRLESYSNVDGWVQYATTAGPGSTAVQTVTGTAPIQASRSGNDVTVSISSTPTFADVTISDTGSNHWSKLQLYSDNSTNANFLEVTNTDTAHRLCIGRDGVGLDNYAAGRPTIHCPGEDIYIYTGAATNRVIASGGIDTSEFVRVFNNAATGGPTVGGSVPSTGTKLLLAPVRNDGTHGDYAVGVDTASPGKMWFQVPSTAEMFRWWCGSTNVMQLSNTGLTINGSSVSTGGPYQPLDSNLTSLSGANPAIPKLTVNGTEDVSDFVRVFNTSLIGAPTVGGTTPSSGTKLLLYPNRSTGSVGDVAMGIESPAGLWIQVPSTSYNITWYGGTTQMMRLTASGLTVNGTNVVTGGPFQPLDSTLTGLSGSTPTLTNKPLTISRTDGLHQGLILQQASSAQSMFLEITNTDVPSHRFIIGRDGTGLVGAVNGRPTIYANGEDIYVATGASNRTIHNGGVDAAAYFRHTDIGPVAGPTVGGSGPPASTKMIYYPGARGSGDGDMSVGVEAASLWHQVRNTGDEFHWYGGTTRWMTLKNSGLTVNSYPVRTTFFETVVTDKSNDIWANSTSFPTTAGYVSPPNIVAGWNLRLNFTMAADFLTAGTATMTLYVRPNGASMSFNIAIAQKVIGLGPSVIGTIRKELTMYCIVPIASSWITGTAANDFILTFDLVGAPAGSWDPTPSNAYTTILYQITPT